MMRWFLAGLCAVGVTACSATSSPERAQLIDQARNAPDRADSLPPQNLPAQSRALACTASRGEVRRAGGQEAKRAVQSFVGVGDVRVQGQ